MADTTTLLTYRELAERLGISPDSARIKAKRRGWRVEPGNHPNDTARVHVPDTELNPPSKPELTPERRGGDHPRTEPPKTVEASVPDNTELVKELRRQIERLEDDLSRERVEHRAERERLEDDLSRERADHRAERERLEGDLNRERVEHREERERLFGMLERATERPPSILSRLLALLPSRSKPS